MSPAGSRPPVQHARDIMSRSTPVIFHARRIPFALPRLFQLALIVLGTVMPHFATSAPVVDPAVCENVVLRWNHAMLDAIRAEGTPPALAARNLAILHLAIHAAASWDPADESDEAADAAALLICETLYPGRAGKFHAVAGISDDPGRSDIPRQMRGNSIARDLLSQREDDGASRSVTFVPQSGPGKWMLTAPLFRPPELPQWPHVRTFFTDLDTLPILAGPPDPDTPEFAAALAEVDRLGRIDSPARSTKQTHTARFWSAFSYTSTPTCHWNFIAARIVRDRGLGKLESALLFARLNAAMADSGIACWQLKYAFNAWRPITALNAGKPSATAAQPDWCPLLPTPAHPEYPSSHSVFSGAAAEVLATFMGTDLCSFHVTSDAVPGVTRTFHRFSDAAEEISLSGVLGGIHFSHSCRDGLILGRAVARSINRHAGLVSRCPANPS